MTCTCEPSQRIPLADTQAERLHRATRGEGRLAPGEGASYAMAVHRQAMDNEGEELISGAKSRGGPDFTDEMRMPLATRACDNCNVSARAPTALRH
eukprot:13019597-Alexandrium_andersonii.AAC.1